MPKTKLHISAFLRAYHFPLLILTVVLILVAEAIFLYYFFYMPLTQTKVIGALREQTALERLDLELFEQLRSAAAKKARPPAFDWNAIRDPFSSTPKASPP